MLDSPLFKSHKLNPDGILKVNFVRNSFNDLLEELFKLLPDNREFSIVRTKLEEASFFAVKSIATSPKNQDPNNQS